jgi:Cu/Ag efflux protein CusF
MKVLTRAALALLVSATVAVPALAQDVTKEKANILAVDWSAMQVRLKDPQGRERTWVVSKDATVEFSDKREQFPNPKLKDLVPPMYVFFSYKSDSKEIVAFEVRQVGFEPGKETKPAPDAPAAGMQSAVITAVDANVGQVEVQLAGGRKTFWVEPKNQLNAYKAGDRVSIQVEKQGDKEVVTRIQRRR